MVVCAYLWFVRWSAVGSFCLLVFVETSRSTAILFNLENVLNQTSKQGRSDYKIIYSLTIYQFR